MIRLHGTTQSLELHLLLTESRTFKLTIRFIGQKPNAVLLKVKYCQNILYSKLNYRSSHSRSSTTNSQISGDRPIKLEAQ